jgi:hypothetical protein
MANEQQKETRLLLRSAAEQPGKMVDGGSGGLVEPYLRHHLKAMAGEGAVGALGVKTQHVNLRLAGMGIAAQLNGVHKARSRPVANVVGGAARGVYAAGILLHGRRNGKLYFRHIQR